MASKTLVTVVGNLMADPELRFTAAGLPVAGFTIASTPRVYDRDRSEFTAGEPLFLRCSLWRQAAEKVPQDAVELGKYVLVRSPGEVAVDGSGAAGSRAGDKPTGSQYGPRRGSRS